MSFAEAAAALDRALKNGNWNPKYPPPLPPSSPESTVKPRLQSNSQVNLNHSIHRENISRHVIYKSENISNSLPRGRRRSSSRYCSQPIIRNSIIKHDEDRMDIFHSIPSFPFHGIGYRKPWESGGSCFIGNIPRVPINNHHRHPSEERYYIERNAKPTDIDEYPYQRNENTMKEYIQRSKRSSSLNSYPGTVKGVSNSDISVGKSPDKRNATNSIKPFNEDVDSHKSKDELDSNEKVEGSVKVNNMRKRKSNTLDFIRKSAKVCAIADSFRSHVNSSKIGDEFEDANNEQCKFELNFPRLKSCEAWNSFVILPEFTSFIEDNFLITSDPKCEEKNSSKMLMNSQEMDCSSLLSDSSIALVSEIFGTSSKRCEEILTGVSGQCVDDDCKPEYTSSNSDSKATYHFINPNLEVIMENELSGFRSLDKSDHNKSRHIDFQSSMDAFVMCTNDDGFMSSSPKSSIIQMPVNESSHLEEKDSTLNDRSDVNCDLDQCSSRIFEIKSNISKDSQEYIEFEDNNIVIASESKQVVEIEDCLDDVFIFEVTESETIKSKPVSTSIGKPTEIVATVRKTAPEVPQHIIDDYFSNGKNSMPFYSEPRRDYHRKNITEESSTSDDVDFQPLDPSKYKTELCRAFQLKGCCKYGSRCNYAHGLEQLKVSFHHGKYKTRNCEAYHETGYCRYGARCSFIHDLEEGILKCSIANKEILEALHYWPEEDYQTSATVTWKVYNGKSLNISDESLTEFTAIPSLKPADVGPATDLDNGCVVPKIYILDTTVTSAPYSRDGVKLKALPPSSNDSVSRIVDPKRGTRPFSSTVRQCSPYSIKHRHKTDIFNSKVHSGLRSNNTRPGIAFRGGNGVVGYVHPYNGNNNSRRMNVRMYNNSNYSYAMRGQVVIRYDSPFTYRTPPNFRRDPKQPSSYDPSYGEICGSIRTRGAMASNCSYRNENNIDRYGNHRDGINSHNCNSQNYSEESFVKRYPNEGNDHVLGNSINKRSHMNENVFHGNVKRSRNEATRYDGQKFDCGISRNNNTSPKYDDMFMQGNGMTRHDNGLSRHDNGLSRHDNGLSRHENGMPRHENVMPRNDNVMPRNDNVMPRNDNMMPRHNNMMPRHNNMMPRHDNMMPRHDNMMPRHDNMMPRHDNMMPRHDNMMPRHDIVMPRHDIVMPRHDIVMPRHDNVMPRNDNVMPRNDNVMPRNDNVMPRNDNVMPRNDNVMPRNDNVMPRNDNVMPRNDNVMPRNDNVMPRHDNVMPRHDNVMPRHDNVMPRHENDIPRHDNVMSRHVNVKSRYDNVTHRHDDVTRRHDDVTRRHDDVMSRLENGMCRYDNGLSRHNNDMSKCKSGIMRYDNRMIRYENGMSRYENGMPRHENGMPRHGNGMPRHENGMPRHENGMSRHENGMSRHENGMSRHENGMSRHENGMSRHENGMSRHENGMSRHENGMPRHENGMPRHENGMPRHENGMPRHENGMPRHENGMPRHENGMPRHENGMPRHENGMPRHENGMPRHENGMPRHENGMPRHENGMPRHENGMPRHENGMPRHENGMPRHENGMPRHENGMPRHENGMPRHENGMPRHENGMPRHENGMPRHENGMQRHENGMQRHENGMQSHEKGMTRPENGMPRPENGMPRPENGMPRPENGMSRPENGMSRPENGWSRHKNDTHPSQTDLLRPKKSVIVHDKYFRMQNMMERYQSNSNLDEQFPKNNFEIDNGTKENGKTEIVNQLVRSENMISRYDDGSPRFENRRPRFESTMCKFEYKEPKFENGMPKFGNEMPTFENGIPRFENGMPEFSNVSFRHDGNPNMSKSMFIKHRFEKEMSENLKHMINKSDVVVENLQSGFSKIRSKLQDSDNCKPNSALNGRGQERVAEKKIDVNSNSGIKLKSQPQYSITPNVLNSTTNAADDPPNSKVNSESKYSRGILSSPHKHVKNRCADFSKESSSANDCSKKCYNYHRKGYCLYGNSCQFLHDGRFTR